MQVVNKKYLILTTILVFWLIAGSVIFFGAKQKNVILEEVKLIDKVDSSMFAIMIGDLEGNYTESEENTLPQKEDGYIFNPNKSICVNSDGEDLGEVLSYRNNMIKLKVREASYCHLYFDVISESDFCIDRGITNLKDCLLVMEDYSYDTEEAIEYIESKGEASTSVIAPTVTYVQTHELKEDENGLVSTADVLALGTEYKFDSETGHYRVLNDQTPAIITDEYIDYYTCGGSWTHCTTMYQVKGYTVVDDGRFVTQYITKADVYTFKSTDTFDSEVGLYAIPDETGTSYFYRGAVKNNYVSYGGFIWRIVRINSNGSIRMIYAGTSTDDTGEALSIGTSKYNKKNWDPTFLGYKYGDDLVLKETTELVTYRGIGVNTIYYFGKGYTQTEDGNFQLDQTQEIISGKWVEIYDEVIENYPYSCFKTSKEAKCDLVMHIKEYVSDKRANVNYIAYSSKDYASTLTNEADSTIKEVVDTWYEENILNKTDNNGNLLEKYLSDEVFCNDRSIFEGDGYKLSTHTYYNMYGREANHEPVLTCTQDEDEFRVANGNLKYPIALITADEVMLAGGTDGVNDQYYLQTGQKYWTMSPIYYYASYNANYVFRVGETGSVTYGTASGTHGVRPVINLSSEVMISQGIGTKDNPYVITLKNT